MAHPQVPKFGNWESGDSVPYTLYFDKVGRGKGRGRMMNPNDPQENPELFAKIAPRAEANPEQHKLVTKPVELIVRGPMRPNHERRRQSSEYPARNENVGWSRGGRGPNSGRPVRRSFGFEHSFERPPLHPHYQAKVAANRHSSSPAWDGKSSHDSNHGTPERPRMRSSIQGRDSPDSVATVPKFGEWDESNTSTTNDYSDIFEKVREERHNAPAKSPNRVPKPSFAPEKMEDDDDDKKTCCFLWGRK